MIEVVHIYKITCMPRGKELVVFCLCFCWVKHCNVVFVKSVFAFQFTKGCKETCERPEEPAGQMRPHWGKVLWRGSWTGEKVCSPLPAPFWQSMSFTRIFIAFPDAKYSNLLTQLTKYEQRMKEEYSGLWWLVPGLGKHIIFHFGAVKLAAIFILICRLAHTLLWKAESSPTEIWEGEMVPATHSVKPLCRSFPWMFFGPSDQRRIRADYASLIWDLKMV